MNQYGSGKCKFCGSVGVNGATCPLNPKAKNVLAEKHYNYKKALSQKSNQTLSKSSSISNDPIKKILNNRKAKSSSESFTDIEKSMKKFSDHLSNKKTLSKTLTLSSNKSDSNDLVDALDIPNQDCSTYKKFKAPKWKDQPNCKWVKKQERKPGYCQNKTKKSSSKTIKKMSVSIKTPEKFISKSSTKSSSNPEQLSYYLEFTEGNSRKFWSIKLVGTNVESNWGKIGSTGRLSVKKFDTKDKAIEFIDKQTKNKIKKGYK